MLTRDAVPFKATPKADEATLWNWSEADGRLRKWAGVDAHIPTPEAWQKYEAAFTWFDGKGGYYSSYKLPHHDVIDGELKVVWTGVAAAMAALLGARGGTSIPEEERQAVYEHLKGHYHQFQKDPPEFKAQKSMPTGSLEVRCYGGMALRDNGGKTVLAGHAAVFNSVGDGGWFTESIAPGAFAKSLASGQEIKALFNHDTGRVLGSKSAGTLSLMEDDKGLAVEIQPPASAADVIESLQRGDINQMSFAFLCRQDEWSNRDAGKKHRTVIEADLREVSIVAFPFYDQTSIGIRDEQARFSWLNSEAYRSSVKNRLAAYERRARIVSLD